MAEFALLILEVTDTVAWLTGLIALLSRWGPAGLLAVLRSTSFDFDPISSLRGLFIHSSPSGG